MREMEESTLPLIVKDDSMTKWMSVGEVARAIEAEGGGPVSARELTGLFYRRALDTSRCPVVRGRRLIPGDYVSEIRTTLTARGYFATREVTHV
jgi:hypothetical protein